MENQIKQQKTSMSVPEMKRMLGLGKTESYWLVHRQYFKTVIVGRNMRVMIDSFEDWYAGQFHYKKIDGPPPGSKWTDTTMSVAETSELLYISDGITYELLKRGCFVAHQISSKKRIDKASFEKWYQNQTHYKKIKVEED